MEKKKTIIIIFILSLAIFLLAAGSIMVYNTSESIELKYIQLSEFEDKEEAIIESAALAGMDISDNNIFTPEIIELEKEISDLGIIQTNGYLLIIIGVILIIIDTILFSKSSKNELPPPSTET